MCFHVWRNINTYTTTQLGVRVAEPSFLLLNTSSSVQLNKVEQKQTPQTLSGRSGDAVHIDKAAIKVDVPDIVSVSACADLTLPAGAGLCIDTIHGPVFLVSILVIVHSRIIL